MYCSRLTTCSLLLSAVGAAGPVVAQSAEVTSSGALVVKYGGVPFLTGDSLLLMDSGYKGIDASSRGPGRTTRVGDVTTTEYTSPLCQLTRTVTQRPDGVNIKYHFRYQPDPRGKYLELTIKIPTAVLDDYPGTTSTHDVQKSNEQLELPSFLGTITCDVRSSTAPWSLDDLRKTEWAQCFRLRFAPSYDPANGLEATAVLDLTAKPSESKAFVALDVTGVGNRALRDEVAGDSQGGWTDQGDNDLRVFTPGRQTFLGLPVQTGDKAVILKGELLPKLPAESAAVTVGSQLSRLYLLHTSAWPAEFRQRLGEYVVTYADGQTATVPIQSGVDVSDWWGASEPLAARAVWTGNNGHATVGLYLCRWNNPRPEQEIASVQLRSTNTSAVPIWLGATGLKVDGLTAGQLALLDDAWKARSQPNISTEGWIPAPIAWNDGITPGSALDVSFLNEKPAGKHGFLKVADGKFQFAGQGKPVRFWGTNAALYGPYPPKEDAPGIARCLARQGVNLVRLHLYAVYDNTMIAPDGNLDPVALDQFCWFIAQLKEYGVYSYLDLNDGMQFERLVGHKLPGTSGNQKMASLFNPELLAAQQKLARMLFTQVNPYTQLKLVDDPAIALYEITNENSLTMAWGDLKQRLGDPYYGQLEQLWHTWLKDHGKEVVPLPSSLGTGSDDSRRFGAELQQQYYTKMWKLFRELGVKAPICGTNITFTLGDLWASEDLDYTNDHGYFDHPNVGARPMTYNNRQAVNSAAWSLPMIPTFARGKVAGKPLVCSEWNYCFPNDYRCEGLPQFTAYSAYQDWDGLLFYCATGSFDGGRWQRFHDNPGILVHSQQCDPATWGQSQACALLYRRGDVQPGKRVVRLHHTDADVWADRSPLGRLPFLPAVARVESDLGPGDDPLEEAAAADAQPGERYAAALKVVGDTQSTETRVVSDTGELVRDASTGIFTVDTPLNQMASGFLSQQAELPLADLRIACATRFASLSLSSLDGRPLRQSQRMLLTAVANARNETTKIDGPRLLDMGKAPVLAEPVTAKLALMADRPGELVVYPLDTLTGERREALAAKVVDGALTWSIGPSQATIYYELARQ